MFSSVGSTTLPSTRHGQATSAKVIEHAITPTVLTKFGLQNYAAQVPRFSVRVFKGPTISSFPYTATAKFDLGHRPTLAPDLRQRQTWYPSNSEFESKSSTAPSEPPKPPHFLTNNASTTNGRGYDPNPPRTSSSYSIYPSAKDTYVYERSLTSKSDLFSSSEYDTASTTTFSPSSAFSPAMSTDSTTTLKGELAVDGPRTARSSPPRKTFPIHIPALAQAQSASRGNFYNQPPQEGLSQANTSFLPHVPSSRPLSLPDSSDRDPRLRAAIPAQGRLTTTPIRLPSPMDHTASRTTSYSSFSSHDLSGHVQHTLDTVSETEDDNLDRLARVNAAYNAVSSASYYPTRNDAGTAPSYRVDHVVSASESTAPDRRVVPTVINESNGVDAGPRQMYANIPLRSSPEQEFIHHSQFMEAPMINGEASFHRSVPAGAMSGNRGHHSTMPSQYPHQTDLEQRLSSNSEEFIPPLAEWEADLEAGLYPSNYGGRPQVVRTQGDQNYGSFPASRTVSGGAARGYPAGWKPSSNPPSAHDRREDPPLPVPPPRQHSSHVEQRQSDFYNTTNERGVSSVLRAPPEETQYSYPHMSEDSRRQDDLPSRRAPEERRRSPVDQRRSPVQQRRSPTEQKRSPVEQKRSPVEQKRSPVEQRRSPTEQRSSAEQRDPVVQRPDSPRSPGVGFEQPRDYPSAPVPRPAMATLDQSTTSTAPPPKSSSEKKVYPRRRNSSAADMSGSKGENRSTPTNPINATPEVSVAEPARVRHIEPSNDTRFTGASGPPTTQPASSRPSTVTPVTGDRDRAFANSVPLSRSTPPANPPLPEARVERSDNISQDYPHHQPPEPSSNYVSHAPGPSQRAYPRGEPADRDGFEQRNIQSSAQQIHYPPVSSYQPQRGNGGTYQTQDSFSTAQPQPLSAERTTFSQPNPLTARGAPLEADTRTLPYRSRTPHPEPRRRRSDGDRPADDTPSLARSSTPYEKASNPSNPVPSTGQTSFLVNAPGHPISPELPEPQRRYSDGDQSIPARPVTATGMNSALRSVRWNDNLICPSPIFPNQRRKGWYNRRGYVAPSFPFSSY